ncbi:MAG TPA: LD-carboxypeptidase [Desulfobulbus sp.]|nr:LD-carboxypeptidase [Desulfobulbus sp.]
MREIAVVDHCSPIVPPTVQPGDTIGLFCPAGPIRNMQSVQQGIGCLRDFGFRIKVVRELQEQTNPHAYLAASDVDRAGELQQLWQDDEVAALMAVRGGFGCLRLLELLDFTMLGDNPKLLIGFSDLTALLAAIHRKTGLIGLHGPVVSTLADSDRSSRQRLFACMTGEYSSCPGTGDVEILRPGTATGPLIVGNLTTLVHLIGTPYEPEFADAILVLEDTGESVYRIDRMLTQLSCAGKLQQAAGIILGFFDNGPGTGFDDMQYRHLCDRVLALTTGQSCPVWSRYAIGHGRFNFALPFGMIAEMGHDGQLRLFPEQAQDTGSRSL